MNSGLIDQLITQNLKSKFCQHDHGFIRSSIVTLLIEKEFEEIAVFNNLNGECHPLSF